MNTFCNKSWTVWSGCKFVTQLLQLSQERLWTFYTTVTPNYTVFQTAQSRLPQGAENAFKESQPGFATSPWHIFLTAISTGCEVFSAPCKMNTRSKNFEQILLVQQKTIAFQTFRALNNILPKPLLTMWTSTNCWQGSSQSIAFLRRT